MLTAISGTVCEPMSSPSGAYTRDKAARDAITQQVLEDHFDLPLTSDQANVSSRRFGEVIQRLFVVLMSASHNQAVGVVVDVESAERVSISPRISRFACGKRSALQYCSRSSTAQTSKSHVAASSPTFWPT